MAFHDRITRHPLPHNTERCAHVRRLFGELPEALVTLLETTAGCSPYLAGLMEREADWIAQLATREAEDLRDGVWQDIEQSEGDMKVVFRQAKRRIALLAAVADIGGVWPLEMVTHALTELADRCLQRGLTELTAAQIARGKLPGQTEADAKIGAGMCILAMGKMGAYELNYSSDIDMICLFDETRFQPDDYLEARTTFIKITRALMSLMSDVTADGYVFRSDLRLRPDASVTPVCIAMETAERYYESVGRTWERAAFIKARPCAGDLEAGERFLDRLSPFIWRKHLDFAAIEDAHDMRLKIRSHKGLGGQMQLDGHNMKLGAGGIREIEFFTQTRQLIAGGRDPHLRVRGTREGLDQLVEAGWVPKDASDRLQAAYVAHREVEHRLQMIGDSQTHELPKNEEGFQRLARFMGEEDIAKFRAGLLARLEEVAEVTDSFFAPDDAEEAPETEGLAPPSTYLEQWRSLPALRSERSVSLFKRVFPTILRQMGQATRPAEAMAEFERFLSGLPAGVQVFSLFDSNPQLTKLIVDICATSPALATYLSRNAGVLDAVIGGDFFADWPDVESLTEHLIEKMQEIGDYEGQLDAARRWQKEWHFRVGVHHLQGLLSPEDASAQYADLAQATLAALLPVVEAEFARKHGPAPGRGAVVLGMGSVGAASLTADSDLDLIVIYDPEGVEQSEGRRPLETRTYFARLTQAFVTALTAPMAEGRLYEVDLRLRPSGQSGPVATSLEAFRNYQMNDAWVWEHLALTRARAVAGNASLQADVEAVRCQALASKFEAEQVKRETREMRVRLAEASGAPQPWDVKSGAGGRQDIELLSQALSLISHGTARKIDLQLSDAKQAGLLSDEQYEHLLSAHALFSKIQMAARLMSTKSLTPEDMGAGGIAMLLRDCNRETVDILADDVAECRKRAAEVVEQLLQ
ncbi:glutamate-ammonia-ligase adenylyltransferase [Litoreibacter ascidiaceicola]|uniref:Glutamate-ammonia-ligase adenylyltransferase n=1 Tax=Litoreibacter ascidiaceicola TaxID=1486859 RepID=A0A1M4W183_9RHOB|nr:glutamine-synthetase adenylyltransferase [Litoreibacter ascidiaceicola]SHE74900.1 glutamate-ammonia-ligase adenylyltransferase [Litoreibacter ascidiaceicola]